MSGITASSSSRMGRRGRAQAFVRRRCDEIDMAPKLRDTVDAVEKATREVFRPAVKAALTSLSAWQPLVRPGATQPLQLAMTQGYDPLGRQQATL